MATKVLAMVLAGGEGSRLRPLTTHQAKPAVPFIDDYRIVDFVLGNMVNSGLSTIYVLGQYKPASLIEHVEKAWARWFNRDGRVLDVVLPGPFDTFRGTADAVYRNLALLEHHRPDVVAVFAADHVYRMDIRQMVHFHRERDAEVTVAALPVPLEQASSFGVISTDSTGCIQRFTEKPESPQPIPGDPLRAFASMGNYLFKPEVLTRLLRQTIESGGSDFGAHLLPTLAASGCRMFAYDFSSNRVPGLQAYEEPAYWRDVGTLQALAESQRDVQGPAPRFDLANRLWPIRRDRLGETALQRQNARRVQRRERRAAKLSGVPEARA